MYKRDRGFGGQHRSYAPIRVGEELDVKIEAVGEKGDGIAKIKGFVIFVPNTKAGEEVRIRINKVSNKVGFGQVIGQESESRQDDSSSSDDSDMEEQSDDSSEETTEDSGNNQDSLQESEQEIEEEDSENF